MFSETKGPGERRLQPITPTPFDLQNGLQSQRDIGQHLRRPQADIHAYFWTRHHIMRTCGPKQANSSCNGCNHTTKQRLSNQRGHVQLDLAGQSCQTELTSVHWNQPPGNGLQHNRVSVNYSLRECSFVIHQHQTEPHLSLRKCALDPPAQFKGHGNCGLPVCVAKQQSASVRGALLKELNASDWAKANEDGFDAHNSTFNSILCSCEEGTLSRYLGHVMKDLNGPSLGHEMMLSTKDAKTTHKQISCQEKVDLRDRNRSALKNFHSKQNQRAIQNQIQNVVVNLEEVLHGLKEIHLEMKEVVQKIDLLTADIDMGEEVPAGTFSSKMESGVREPESMSYGIDRVASSRQVDNLCFNTPIVEGGNELFSTNKPHPSHTNIPPVAPPAYPIRDQGQHGTVQQLRLTQERVNSQRHESRTATERRGKKPPPYPHANTTGRANPKAKDRGKKAPPYPFKRRLLSTIV